MVEFDQNGVYFQHNHSLPCGTVYTLLPSVLQHLDSRRGIEAIILILEKVLNCRL